MPAPFPLRAGLHIGPQLASKFAAGAKLLGLNHRSTFELDNKGVIGGHSGQWLCLGERRPATQLATRDDSCQAPWTWKNIQENPFLRARRVRVKFERNACDWEDCVNFTSAGPGSGAANDLCWAEVNVQS